MNETLAAFFIRTKLLNYRDQVVDHRATMHKKKQKHPSKMSNDELAALVFHPKVLKHAKEPSSGSLWQDQPCVKYIIPDGVFYGSDHDAAKILEKNRRFLEATGSGRCASR